MKRSNDRPPGAKSPNMPKINHPEPMYQWVDGVRHRWKRYSNPQHTSDCLFYLVADPDSQGGGREAAVEGE